MRGGYLILDLKNTNFSSGVGIVIPNIYDRIESTRKPVRLSNIVFEGKELRDIDINYLYAFGSTYTTSITVGALSIEIVIADTDVVTVTQK